MTHESRMRKSDRKRQVQQVESEYQVFDKGQTKVIPFQPKTQKQQQLYNTILENQFIIAIGPAGTAKSYTAAAAAIHLYLTKQISQIIIARNPVPTGYTTGLKPGESNEKLLPWLSPILGNLKKCCESDTNKFGFFNYLMEKGIIKMQELEVIKGETFDDSFIIIEECQECDIEILKTISTRASDSCWVYLDGDVNQGNARLRGSKDFQRYLDGIKKMNELVYNGKFEDVGEDWAEIIVPVIEMTKEDCVRGGLTRWMLEMFDNSEL